MSPYLAMNASTVHTTSAQKPIRRPGKTWEYAPYEYAEIMGCPSGVTSFAIGTNICQNGGGMIIRHGKREYITLQRLTVTRLRCQVEQSPLDPFRGNFVHCVHKSLRRTRRRPFLDMFGNIRHSCQPPARDGSARQITRREHPESIAAVRRVSFRCR